MKIRLLPPLDRILGPVKDIRLPQPVTVARVLGMLKAQAPAFVPYARFGPQDKHPYGLLIFRRGKVLTLLDKVEPTDEIEIIIMVSGG